MLKKHLSKTSYRKVAQALTNPFGLDAYYEKAGEPSRVVNLYCAVLSGPLRNNTREDVENMLNACLAGLDYQTPEKGSIQLPRWS